MFNYAQQRELELLAVAAIAEEQITWNKTWIEQGIPLQYNSEGKLVATRAIPLSFKVEDYI